MQVSVNTNCESNEEKILELQEVIRDMALENDEIQLSRSDRYLRSGGRAPSCWKILYFLQNRLNFRPILIKTIALKHGIKS